MKPANERNAATNERDAQVMSRDIQVFKAICEFMEREGGDPPKISDLVAIVNECEGLPNDEKKSVGNATISDSLNRLEGIGLISMRRIHDRRSAGSLRIIKSKFEILITTDEAREEIKSYYHEPDTTQ